MLYSKFGRVWRIPFGTPTLWPLSNTILFELFVHIRPHFYHKFINN